jgi:PTS system galactitol-specific IIB component
MKKRILVSCGAGAATSTAVAARLRNLCEDHDIPVTIVTCMAAEIPSRVEMHPPDLIVATVQKPPEIDIPYFNGIPYLTGIGAKELDQKILDFLQSLPAD